LENFLLNVYVARSLGVAQLGAFSLAYVTYGLANNANRGLAIEPLLVRFSASGPRIWRRAAKGSVSTSLLVGIVLGLCALAAGAVIGGTTGLAFYGLGVVFPVVLLQDSWRYAFFSWGRGYHALINDTIWLIVQLPLMIFLKRTGHANVFWFVLAWGAGAFVGAIVGSFQAKIVPNLGTTKQWLVRHRDLGLRFLVENTGGNASTTLLSYGISYILGIVAVGSIRAAGVLMGPLNIMFYGIGMLTVPEAARILHKSPRRLPLYCIALSAGLTTLTLLWTVLLLVGLPHGLGNLMLGGIWRHTYPLVLPTAALTVAGALGIGAGVGLHALGAARRSMRATLIGSGLILAFSLLGAAIAGVVGTLYFGAVATVISTVISWWQFRKALREPNSVRDSHQSRKNGHQRPDAQVGLPGAGYPDEESADPGYSSRGYSGNGQSGTSYAGEGYGPSGYGGSQSGNPQFGKSPYGSGAYGAGGYSSQGIASAGQAGTGGAVGYRDAGYGGGSGAAYGDQGHQGADYQDPSYGQRHHGGFGRGPGSAANGSANGHAVAFAYQGGPSARGRRPMSPQEPGPDIPQFTVPGAVAAANENSTATPRPYGRISIFTLLDDKVVEFDRLAERAAEGVRTAEPDTLVYVINVVPGAPMQRIIYEIYRDRMAFKSHEQQPHSQRFAEDRRSCVQAVNVIDLRLKYAKVATLGASAVPQDSRYSQGTQTTRVSQTIEPSTGTYASSGPDGLEGGTTPSGGRTLGSGRAWSVGPLGNQGSSADSVRYPPNGSYLGQREQYGDR
jgi:O-antigen/teichoic acid export membrane protein/quinol monooxygenase YgiN